MKEKNHKMSLLNEINELKPFESRLKVFLTYNRFKEELSEIFETLNIEISLLEPPASREDFFNSLKGCHGIICTPFFYKFDSEAFNAAGDQLKVISTISMGTDHIDLPECKSKNILVGTIGTLFNEATAEMAIALLFSASRRVNLCHELGKKESWIKLGEKKSLVGKRLKGTTVGILGLGTLANRLKGMAVAKKLSGFEVKKVIYHNRNVREEATQLNYEYVSFEELLQQSDFLICTCSANKDNLDKFNLDAFKKMKPDSIFINVARGHIVNHDDLYQALSTNIIGAAALDVTKPEPLLSDHGLYTLQNCIITPHMAWNDDKTRGDLMHIALLNLVKGLRGEPLIYQIS